MLKVIEESLPVLCCDFDIDKDTVVEVYKQTSKNRTIVAIRSNDRKNQCHKVKTSTLRRCTEEIK